MVSVVKTDKLIKACAKIGSRYYENEKSYLEGAESVGLIRGTVPAHLAAYTIIKVRIAS